MEAEAERSNQRAEDIECKLIDIEDELKVVGQNQQTLEVIKVYVHYISL